MVVLIVSVVAVFGVTEVATVSGGVGVSGVE